MYLLLFYNKNNLCAVPILWLRNDLLHVYIDIYSFHSHLLDLSAEHRRRTHLLRSFCYATTTTGSANLIFQSHHSIRVLLPARGSCDLTSSLRTENHFIFFSFPHRLRSINVLNRVQCTRDHLIYCFFFSFLQWYHKHANTKADDSNADSAYHVCWPAASRSIRVRAAWYGRVAWIKSCIRNQQREWCKMRVSQPLKWNQSCPHRCVF